MRFGSILVSCFFVGARLDAPADLETHDGRAKRSPLRWRVSLSAKSSLAA